MSKGRKSTKLDARYWKLVSRVASNIKATRQRMKLSQEDMTQFGFERRWFQRIESGEYSVSLPTLDLLARALKVDIAEFFR